MGGIAAAAWLTVFLADQLQPSSTPLALRPGNKGAAALAPAATGLRSRPWPRRNGGRVLPPPTSQAPARSVSPNLAFLRPAGSVSASDLASPGPSPQRPSDPSRLSLPGSLLLGGPLSLSSLQEKLMVPAARTEQAQRDAAADRLKGLPTRWRYAIRWLTHGSRQLLPAEVVRLPAPDLQQPEEIPLAMTGDRLAETTVRPSSARSKRALERWAERQPRVPDGQVRPVLVVLEPLARVSPSCLEAASPVVQASKPGSPTATSLSPQAIPAPQPNPGGQEPRPAAAATPAVGVEPIPASALIGTPLPP